ncbi:MAG TPA: Uma2 family endonuclease [Pseudonocardiaceae bacterium]|nr:Uma2 family endonuclease [Pseudonocardiaceae bacterium]
MTTVTSPRRIADFTLDDWERLEPVEGYRVELVDGLYRVNAAPVPWHQKVADRLGRMLAPIVEPLGWDVLSAIGVRIRPGLGYIPDLVICERVPRGAKSVTAATIVLAVEVVSPSSRKIDRHEKPIAYAKAGIPAYWRAEIVKDHLTSVHCYRLEDNGHYVEHTVVEPGKPQTISLPIDAEITLDVDTLDR